MKKLLGKFLKWTLPVIFKCYDQTKRLLAVGVEIMLKKMGEQSDVHHVHPHKFRRTLATMAIDRGMPIEQIQRLLGPQRIDTTLQYAMVKQTNVKTAHRKYIG